MMRRNNYRVALLKVTVSLIACFVVCLWPFASALAHTEAASNGRIYGQLLDGSNKKAPVGGQSVTLQMAENGSARDLKSVTTDGQGNYAFDGLATDKAISYAVFIRYQGAQYVSDLVTLDSKPTQQVNLTVYQATTSTADIAVTQATVLVREPNIQSHMITFSEVYAFKNLSTRTYVGSLDASKGKPNALLFSLPSDARNITLSKGFDGYREIQVDHGFATDAALPPGDSEFAFTFSVPYSGSTYDFSYTTMYPTVSLSFLVPPDLHADAGKMSAQGVVTSADQHSYRLFKADKLLANQEMHLSLQGLITSQTIDSAPTQSGSGGPSGSTGNSNSNSSLVLLIGALLVMLAILAVTWYLYSSGRSAGPVKKETRKGAVSEKGRQKSGATKGATVEGKQKPKATKGATDEREQELLQELLRLDKEYEAGKLTKAVYQERRGKTKARLRALMSEQETARR